MNYILRSFMTCTPHQISSERPNQGEQDGRGMWHAWERGETHTGFWREPWKKPPGRSRRRSDDNNKMCLQQISWDDVKWIDLTQGKEKWRALVNGVSSFIKCWTLLYSMGSFSQSWWSRASKYQPKISNFIKQCIHTINGYNRFLTNVSSDTVFTEMHHDLQPARQSTRHKYQISSKWGLSVQWSSWLLSDTLDGHAEAIRRWYVISKRA